MPDKIFLSYRRDDDPNGAGRIRDALTAKFGRPSVFMDVDDLLAGRRFDEELSKALAACDVFLAVIGPRWIDLLKAKSSSRDRDYVREEIAEALKRKIVVIPVRVGREGQLPALPRADELPSEIRDLVLYQKHDVTHEHFGRDIAELTDAINSIRRSKRPQMSTRRAPWAWAATAAIVIALCYVGGYYAGLPVPWLAATSADKDRSARTTATDAPRTQTMERQKLHGTPAQRDDESQHVTPDQNAKFRPATLHVVSIADSTDAIIGKGMSANSKAIQSYASLISAIAKVDLHVVDISGSKFSCSAINKAVQELQPEPDDVIVFYYSGHGVGEQKSIFPSFYCGAVGPYPNLQAISQAIGAKGARFTITVADTCDEIMAEMSIQVNGSKGIIDEHLRSMFLDNKGNILISSSTRGEHSWCNSTGGLFTTRFIRILQNPPDVAPNKLWDAIVNKAIERIVVPSFPNAFAQPQAESANVKFRSEKITPH